MVASEQKSPSFILASFFNVLLFPLKVTQYVVFV